MESVLEIDPLGEFLSAIKNPLTRDHYQRHLSPFFQFLKIEGSLKEQVKIFVSKSKTDTGAAWATYQINEYMRTQRERAEAGKISESTLANYWKPIKLLCEESDINLNWKKILRRVPKGISYAEDTIPEIEQIKLLCTYPDPRIKAAVLIMESSGARIGAFDYLNVGHVKPIKKNDDIVAAKIIIYAGTSEKYYSFITPECYDAIQSYLQHRRDAGEIITDDSPLFRDLIRVFDRWGLGQAKHPKKLKASGVKRLIEDALKVMRLRNKLPPGKRRHSFSSCHSLRKFFKTTCERKMKSLYVEMLMGHKLGVSQSYVRPSESDLLGDYLNAVQDLSIFERHEQTPPNEDVESLKKEMADVKSQLAEAIATIREIREENRRALQSPKKS